MKTGKAIEAKQQSERIIVKTKFNNNKAFKLFKNSMIKNNVLEVVRIKISLLNYNKYLGYY